MALQIQEDSWYWEGLVGRFRNQKVAVCGDLMLDEYVWGTVERISPEAPVPIVSVTRESRVPGGAANVAANVAALGGTPFLLGVVGNDKAGQALLEGCQQRAIQVDGVLQSADRLTTIKTRVVAHNQQVVRIDREERIALSTSQVRELGDHCEEKFRAANAVIVSDYNKGVVTPELLSRISQFCRRKSIPLFLDCKQRKFRSGLWLTGLTPNERELEVLSATPIRNLGNLRTASQRLFRLLDLSCILVTRGEQGMVLFEKKGGVQQIPAVAREVFDVTGAGDTVIATFALAYASGVPAREAVVLASAAAAQVVSKAGTATASPEEILQAIRENGLGSFARSAAREWREVVASA